MDGDLAALRERLGDAVSDPVPDRCGVPGVAVAREAFREAAAVLRDRGYDYLRDITAVDRSALPPWMERTPRFEVVALVTNLATGATVRLRTFAGDGEAVPSLVPVWPAANLLEREVFDLMGVRFEGHPDLRRILLAEDWEGHPLRKDYPVEGYDLWNPFARK